MAQAVRSPRTRARLLTPRWQSYGFLLVNTLCWGAALIVVKPALEVTTPFRFLFYRYLLAAMASIPLLVYYLPRLPRKPVLPTQLLRISLVEVIGTGLALSLLYTGLAYTSAIEASLIAITSPLFITAGGLLLLKEKQERHEWLGLGLTLLGTLWLTLIPLLDRLGSWQALATSIVIGGGAALIGNMFVVGHNIANGAYFVLAKRVYTGWPKLFVTTVSFYVGLVIFGLLSWAESGFYFANWLELMQQDLSSSTVWVAALYMAVAGSIIGLTAYIKGQEGVEASEASLFWYLQPLVALPLGVLWLGEVVSWQQVLALGLVIAGVLVAERRQSVT